MKTVLLILVGGFFLAGNSGIVGKKNASKQFSPKTTSPDSLQFAENIEPVLIKNCSPCHFPGGKMYAKLPFDIPQTILNQKEERVLMRLKNENEKELIKKFIEQKGQQ
ncbi:MAG: hypothetical protein ACHQEB_05565 [Chitinophagales bacterium]